jgi:uncharacterized protein
VSRMNYRQSDAPSQDSSRLRAFFDDRPQLPYLLPLMAFLLVTAPAAFFGSLGGIDWKSLWHTYHPAVYATKSLLAAVLLWMLWRYYTTIRWSKLHWGVVAGLFGTIMWVATEYACQAIGITAKPDPKNFFNPDIELPDRAARWTYLVIRVAGPTLVVPFMEELFFRDFLMRAFIRGARFQDVAVATFTWFSFIATSLLFGINHGSMWPAGILYGMLMAILLYRTKSLGACIVAHGVTNLTLYLYVIYAGDWQFM